MYKNCGREKHTKTLRSERGAGGGGRQEQRAVIFRRVALFSDRSHSSKLGHAGLLTVAVLWQEVPGWIVKHTFTLHSLQVLCVYVYMYSDMITVAAAFFFPVAKNQLFNYMVCD
jgi:hypothetical protein